MLNSTRLEWREKRQSNARKEDVTGRRKKKTRTRTGEERFGGVSNPDVLSFDEMSASAAEATRRTENVGEERDVEDPRVGRIGGGASSLVLFYTHCIHE